MLWRVWPIISAGDVTGAVAFLDDGSGAAVNHCQKTLIQAASQFLENNWNPDFVGINESAERSGCCTNKTTRRILLGKK